MEKMQKLIIELESAQAQLSEVESRAIIAAKNASTAESQLAELQVHISPSFVHLKLDRVTFNFIWTLQALLDSETKQKMALKAELRQSEASREQIKEQLDEEEETRRVVEKQVTCPFRKSSWNLDTYFNVLNFWFFPF